MMPPFSTKHWPRYDHVIRTRALHLMWAVVDWPEENCYLIMHYDARKPRAAPTEVMTVPYAREEAWAYAQEVCHELKRNAQRARITTPGQ